MNARHFAFAALVLTLACSDKDAATDDTSATDDSAAGDDSATGDGALSAADIAGRWVSGGCEAYPNGDGTYSYLTRDFTLTETTWHLSLGVYGDADCSYPLFGAEIDGPYTLGGASATVAGATEADFGFEQNVWTALDAGMADYFTASGCGAEAWVVGEPQDVGQTGCIGVAHVIAECPVEYDLVALSGGQFFLGERITDMCTEAGRPAALGAYGLDAG